MHRSEIGCLIGADRAVIIRGIEAVRYRVLVRRPTDWSDRMYRMQGITDSAADA
jgi:hypothetical protein